MPDRMLFNREKFIRDMPLGIEVWLQEKEEIFKLATKLVMAQNKQGIIDSPMERFTFIKDLGDEELWVDKKGNKIVIDKGCPVVYG